MFVQDFILNGQGHGAVAEMLQNCRFDPGMLRPYFDQRGRRCVTVNSGRTKYDAKSGLHLPVYQKILVKDLMDRGIYSPVFNATSLRKDEWIQLDRVVLQAARQRLRAWTDLAGSNTFGGFNAMSKMVLEHETMNDPGEAVVDMDGLTAGRSDSPRFQLQGLPLPITHCDFDFSQRKLAVSRNSGTPLDTTMGAVAGRRVAETIEKTLIGVQAGVTYGSATAYGNDPTVYGYATHPDRNTKTDITAPTTGGWIPSTLVDEVLEMRQDLYDDYFTGPYMLYHSADWDQYLDDDYYALATTGMAAPNQTLRQRLRQIEGIQDVRRLDFFSSTFSLLLVQMTEDVARAVNGMDITTVQWESQGGMRLNFKVMAIMVPQIRSDHNGRCGICHGSTS